MIPNLINDIKFFSINLNRKSSMYARKFIFMIINTMSRIDGEQFEIKAVKMSNLSVVFTRRNNDMLRR